MPGDNSEILPPQVVAIRPKVCQGNKPAINPVNFS